MKEIFIGLLIVLLLFIVVLIFFGLKAKLTARKLSERKQHKTKEEQTEYANKLSEMIKCETVSNSESYDDTEFKKLRDVMAELFPLIHEKAEKRRLAEGAKINKAV
jgi:carboxypeptidase PM20D1